VGLLVLSGFAGALLLVRAVRDRGGTLRLASLLLHRLALAPAHGGPNPIGDSRLYARRRRRLGAHLSRFPDGRLAVVALPLDGSRRASVYAVGASHPWEDFEHQAGLAGAPWGPLRSISAGL